MSILTSSPLRLKVSTVTFDLRPPRKPAASSKCTCQMCGTITWLTHDGLLLPHIVGRSAELRPPLITSHPPIAAHSGLKEGGAGLGRHARRAVLR